MLASAVLLIQLPGIQTYLSKKIAQDLSKELNTAVSIEEVDIDFFNSLILKGLYIEDQKGDTLIYSKVFTAHISSFNFKKKSIHISDLLLDETELNLRVYKGKEVNNMDFLLKYFVSSDTSAKANWLVDFDNLRVQNSSFRFDNFNYEASGKKNFLDFYHLNVNDISGNFLNTSINMDTVISTIESLSLSDKSGFNLHSLSSQATFYPGLISFEKLNIKTALSEIYTNLSFHMEDNSDLAHFIEKVDLDAKFYGSVINLKDLAYFVPNMQHLEFPVSISGTVEGSIDNLSGKNVKMQFFDDTYFFGDFDIKGLPHFEESSIFLRVIELTTTAEDMAQFPIPPFNESVNFKVPENFYKLGKIYFTGRFTGFYNDFVAYGNFYTDLGKMKTDISLKQKEGIFSYRGNIASGGFDIGEFMDVENLSKMAMNINVDGRGFSKDEIKLNIDGKVNQVRYRGYSYKNIDVSGRLTNTKFSGDVEINDPNLILDFSGTVDASGKKPISKFKAKVEKAYLANLKLFHEKDSLSNLTFDANFNLVGQSIDEIEGSIHITDIEYHDRKRNYTFDQISLQATQQANNKQLVLNSSFFDLTLAGDYELKNLDASLKEFASIYIPSFQYEIDESLKNDLNFNLLIKNADPLSDIFLPLLKIDSGSVINGSFSTTEEELQLGGSIPHLSYADIDFRNVVISGRNDADSLNVNFAIESIHFVDSPALKAVEIDFTTYFNTLLTSIQWDNKSRKVNSANINIETAFNGFDNFSMVFFNTYLIVSDSMWHINKNNEVQVFEDKVEIYNLEFFSGQQSIELDGTLSNDSKAALTLDLKMLDLDYLSDFVPKGILELKGEANGFVKLSRPDSSAIAVSDLNLSNFVLNNIEIGESAINTSWNSELKKLGLNATFGDSTASILTAKGEVYPFQEEDNLDLEVIVDSMPLNMLERYINDYLSEISGYASGKLAVNGNFKEPYVIGEFDLDSARMKVDYLNTIYTINDGFFVEKDFIGFDLIRIVDENGNKGIATGSIFHDRYTDFNLDIGLEVDNFMALNTSSSDNDIYYGKAIVSGLANISGFADQLIFDINIQTEKGTNFFIPLDRESEVSRSNFLTFTNASTTEVIRNDYKVDLTGIQLNFDLQVTPDANVSLVFDERIGDVMKARGSGNLKLEINTLGNFNMFGQYAIQDGEYLFTLQNVINKKFEMEKGGRISWNGDPYDANIDISAVYSLRASLYDILVDTTGTYKRRIPVDLKLLMSGKLLNPEIEFEIELPTADDRSRQALQSILYVNSNEVNRQEMNQQVFGLLVMNRFLPPSGVGQVNEDYQRTNILNQSSTEFLSNQLSNWLSRLSDDVDIGIRYSPGDEISSDEVELELSTEILNDRVILDGNFGYSNNEYNINNQNNSGLIGEFSIEYKMSEDGRLRIRGFNRSNNNSLLRTNSPYTQGFGIFYREEFNHLGELWRKWWRISSAKTEENETYIPER